MNTGFLGPAVATVLTVHGIETIEVCRMYHPCRSVATVLTVHGIETSLDNLINKSNTERVLQQYLPFTVLKLCILRYFSSNLICTSVATVLTVHGIETITGSCPCHKPKYNASCNSTYRSRYWNRMYIQGRIHLSFQVATVLTVHGIETYWITHLHLLE